MAWSPLLFCAIPSHRLCAYLPLLHRQGSTYYFPGEAPCARFTEADILARGCHVWRVPARWDRERPTHAFYLQQVCLGELGPLDLATYLRPHHFLQLPFLPMACITVAEPDLIINQRQEWSRRLLRSMKKVGPDASCSRKAIKIGLDLAVTAEMRQGFLELYRQLPSVLSPTE